MASLHSKRKLAKIEYHGSMLWFESGMFPIGSWFNACSMSDVMDLVNYGAFRKLGLTSRRILGVCRKTFKESLKDYTMCNGAEFPAGAPEWAMHEILRGKFKL